MILKANRRVNRLALFFRVLIILLAIVVLVLLYSLFRSNKKDIVAQDKNNKEAVLMAVSRLMVLPDETGVVVATVSDREKLREQDFFRLAENGDKVVVFPKARQAVLYRPGVDKIVTIAPLASADASADKR